MWRDIKKIIHANQEFILTTHLNPDGDGIGSACALTELLLQMGKKVRFVCDSPIPSKFRFLDYHSTHEIFYPENKYTEAQVLIVLDTHKRERIGRLTKLINYPKIETICIDHHEVVETFTSHIAIDSRACSVGAMVYTLYKESGFELTVQAATGIYVSIVCDTGRFCYSSTNRKAHKIADECIKLGVDPDLIYSKLFQHVSIAETRLFAQALQGMEAYLDNKVVIQQIRWKDCKNFGQPAFDLEHIDLEYIHDFNNMLEDVLCVVLLRELSENNVRVSLRSKTDLDISSIVKSLGGGGHANAAGLTWKGSLDDIKSRILGSLKQLMENKNAVKSSGQNFSSRF